MIRATPRYEGYNKYLAMKKTEATKPIPPVPAPTPPPAPVSPNNPNVGPNLGGPPATISPPNSSAPSTPPTSSTSSVPPPSSSSSSGTSNSSSSGSSSNSQPTENPVSAFPTSSTSNTTYAGHGGSSDGSKAVDYVASAGTPITAPYDGEVFGVRNVYPNDANYWNGQWQVAYDFIVSPNGEPKLPEWSYGNYIMVKYTLDSGEELYFMYAHLQQVNIPWEKNQPVSAGDVIAFVGNTGRSQTPHLHVEVRRSQFYSSLLPNPHNYLP